MPVTGSRRQSKSATLESLWPSDTELVGLSLQLQPHTDLSLPPHYTTELHSWFLDQVRRMDYELSSYLHDGQSEKPFTLSGLTPTNPKAHPATQKATSLTTAFSAHQTYQWHITVLSKPVVEWLHQWLQAFPTEMTLRSGTFKILRWEIDQSATTYTQLLDSTDVDSDSLTLSFLSPTSFRHRGNHLPLPVPENLFHSYLRRWNHFSPEEVDQADFLDWIDTSVVILRHDIRSAKVLAGKKGSVTGFTGSVQLALTATAKQAPEYVELWGALGRLAPYAGTGHKTTFGLGQTRLGWSTQVATLQTTTVQDVLTQRIEELTELFKGQRKRTGGDRATQIAETWATIIARRELGDSLGAIADDLEMSYETIKRYAKLARHALNSSDSD